MKQKITELLQPVSGICVIAGVTLTIFTRDNTAPLIFLISGMLTMLLSIYFEDTIYFAKVKPDAIIPSKRDEDGAADLYACFIEDYMVIKPNEIKLIPTGIASSFSKKWRIVFQERGSTGVIGLKINAGLIDSGYRNEWFVCLNNTSNKTIVIDKTVDQKIEDDCSVKYPYTKAIAQIKVQKVPEVKVKETTYEKILNIKSERGLGSLGSSQK